LHAFGLAHDYRNDKISMNFDGKRIAAGWQVALPTQFPDDDTQLGYGGGFSIEQESIFQCDVTVTDVTKPIVNI